MLRKIVGVSLARVMYWLCGVLGGLYMLSLRAGWALPTRPLFHPLIYAMYGITYYTGYAQMRVLTAATRVDLWAVGK